jgi:hypothetical protein
MESSETLQNLCESLRIQDFALFQKQNISVPYFGNISQKAEQKFPILGKNSQNRTILFCFGKKFHGIQENLMESKAFQGISRNLGM